MYDSFLLLLIQWYAALLRVREKIVMYTPILCDADFFTRTLYCLHIITLYTALTRTLQVQGVWTSFLCAFITYCVVISMLHGFSCTCATQDAWIWVHLFDFFCLHVFIFFVVLHIASYKSQISTEVVGEDEFCWGPFLLAYLQKLWQDVDSSCAWASGLVFYH